MITSVIVCALTCLCMILAVLKKPRIQILKKEIDSYPIVVLLGACVMLLLGKIKLGQVFDSFLSNSAINPLKILILFISMTVLSVFLDEVGFFRYVANCTLKKANTAQSKLFLYLYLTVSVLTVFTSNDIIILTFTPFICYFAKHADISPLPYLIAEFVAANTWSMALVIGNPTNIYLASAMEIDFFGYFKVMILPTLCAGLLAFALLRIIFAKELKKPLKCEYEDCKIANKTLLIIGLVHLGGCTLMLAIASYIGLQMWLISLGFALSLLVFVSVYAFLHHQKPTVLAISLKRAPWQLVPFVLSMFVLILGLAETGATAALANLLGQNHAVFTYGFTSFLASNLINNIPMSVLFGSVLACFEGANTTAAVFATVIGSNIGAFLTPIGALAGIMWADMLKKQNVKFGYRSFISYGAMIALPVMAVSLLALAFVCGAF